MWPARRQVKNSFVVHQVYYAAVNHTTPSNLTYAWNFGSLAFLCLAFQIVTGVCLAMHYNSDLNLAFLSVEHVMRDVPYGWLLRYMHANGASMFFVVVYLHIVRGMYYSSYSWPRQAVWLLGVVLLLLMMATAFVGYVLPWGQMSLWGATVITNLLGAVPYVGSALLEWLWGGYAVGGPTLSRFFALHYLLPFLILGVALIHVIVLQHFGSNNPLGINFVSLDSIPFTPYYLVKDVWGFVLFGLFYSYFIFLAPNFLGHPDNYVMANPMVTPPHIVPEWYFLPFYAILRTMPGKLLGVVAMGAGILILAVLPFSSIANLRSMQFRPLAKFLFWWWVAAAISLGVLGGLPVVKVLRMSLVWCTSFYFLYFVFLGPAVDYVENMVGSGSWFSRSNTL